MIERQLISIQQLSDLFPQNVRFPLTGVFCFTFFLFPFLISLTCFSAVVRVKVIAALIMSEKLLSCTSVVKSWLTEANLHHVSDIKAPHVHLCSSRSILQENTVFSPLSIKQPCCKTCHLKGSFN